MSPLIRYLDRTLSFRRLLWGVPLCVAAHNLEEARRVGEFAGLTRRVNPWITLGERQFLVLAALMTLAVVALASRAAAGDERCATLLLWVQAGLFVNAFAPLHAGCRHRRAAQHPLRVLPVPPHPRRGQLASALIRRRASCSPGRGARTAARPGVAVDARAGRIVRRTR